ncbi:MAG: ATP-dependent DNA helicase [Magnetococcales bacterium]|nr:ATP-dependent DNA helicase [Magnetococcales bacterium]
MVDWQNQVKQLFGAESLLAQKIVGYEPRLQQERMATLVLQAVDANRPLLVEAATGTGKTLAYLLPLLNRGKRVIVSTATKALQDQIVGKDLTLVRQVLPRRFTMSVLKGRANYLCQLRYQQFKGTASVRLSLREQRWLSHVDRWLENTRTGDRDELENTPDGPNLWAQFHADANYCPGRACPDAKECFLAHARRRAMDADLVVVNHYLFFADLAVKDGGFGELLPKADVVVFDEAHRIPDIVTRFFGWEITSGQIQELVRDSRDQMEAVGLVDAAFTGGIENLENVLTELRNAFPQENARGALFQDPMDQSRGQAWLSVEAALHRLLDCMEPIIPKVLGLTGCMRRTTELLENSGRIRVLQDPGRVHWFETRGRFLTLSASPIETGPTLRELLYPTADCHLFTSATLATGKGDEGFHFFARQLGLEPGEMMVHRLPPPFDHANRTLLYVPQGFPEPSHKDFPEAVVEEIFQLLDFSHGRALVLFTSQRMLEFVHERLRDRLRFPLLVQGTQSNSALLKRFTVEVSSVLLGLSSFWEGVDVPGESLSMVVIDRLPFASPGDPLVAAKSRWLESQQINPFKEMYIPKAILSLKQGLGRLLRRKDDRGVMAVLDRRMVDKWYARWFLEGLPPSPLTREREAVRRFFQ